MANLRITFVNRFYSPDTPATGQLLTDLATALAAHGHSVSVITSRPAGNTVPAGETDRGVTIVRVRSLRRGDGSIAGKAIAFAAFAVGASWRLWRKARRGDVIVAMTDPPLLGMVAALIAEIRGARVVHWIQDIYPEVAVAVTGHRWLSWIRPARNAAWQNAERCVVLGAEMAEVAADARVPRTRIAAIPNWPPAGLAPVPPTDSSVLALRRTWDLDRKFVVGYSGNLGRVHDLGPVVNAAATLASDSRITFVLIGTGAQSVTIADEVRRRALTNVRFFPPQPRDQLAVTLGAADVHLVTLRPGCERYVFPSKLYGIAAVGRPVLFIGPLDCELARLVRTHELGLVVDRDDPAAIASAVRLLVADPDYRGKLSTNAARFGAAHRVEVAVDRWQRLLGELEAC